MKKSVYTGLVASTLLMGAVSHALPTTVDKSTIDAGCKNLAIKQAELLDKMFSSVPTPADNDGNPLNLTLGLDPAYGIGPVVQTFQATDLPNFPEEIYNIEVDQKGQDGTVYSKHVVEVSYGSRSGCAITGLIKGN
jgi:hypothetical protein